ncbi:MAG: hypothetical protein RL839_03530 [Gammaproteobacteria bacterium]
MAEALWRLEERLEFAPVSNTTTKQINANWRKLADSFSTKSSDQQLCTKFVHGRKDARQYCIGNFCPGFAS